MHRNNRKMSAARTARTHVLGKAYNFAYDAVRGNNYNFNTIGSPDRAELSALLADAFKAIVEEMNDNMAPYLSK